MGKFGSRGRGGGRKYRERVKTWLSGEKLSGQSLWGRNTCHTVCWDRGKKSMKAGAEREGGGGEMLSERQPGLPESAVET